MGTNELRKAHAITRETLRDSRLPFYGHRNALHKCLGEYVLSACFFFTFCLWQLLMLLELWIIAVVVAFVDMSSFLFGMSCWIVEYLMKYKNISASRYSSKLIPLCLHESKSCLNKNSSRLTNCLIIRIREGYRDALIMNKIFRSPTRTTTIQMNVVQQYRSSRALNVVPTMTALHRAFDLCVAIVRIAKQLHV